jgi:hypothetical protein
MAKKVALRLKNRFAGKENEILQCVRVHGMVGAMMRYEVGDYLCWSRYIENLRHQFAQGEPLGEYSPLPDESLKTAVVPAGERNIVVNIPASDKTDERLFLGYCPNRRQLADELVEAFTDKIVRLSAENARLRSENDVLKSKLSSYEDKNDDLLSARIIQSIEVIKKC